VDSLDEIDSVFLQMLNYLPNSKFIFINEHLEKLVVIQDSALFYYSFKKKHINQNLKIKNFLTDKNLKMKIQNFTEFIFKKKHINQN